MFGDHIASAMARERQRDLVPELRALERFASRVEATRRDTAEPMAEHDDRRPGSAHAEQAGGQRPAVGGELT
jgi:hypothetical protein